MKKFTQKINEVLSEESALKAKLIESGLATDMVDKAVNIYYNTSDKYELYHKLRNIGLEGATIFACFPQSF